MFFDIDGTLMEDSDTHFVPDSTRTALKLARAAGNLLIVNTGRPLVNVDENVRELGFDGYICGCGTYIECEGHELFYDTNAPALCRKTAKLVRKCGASPLYERRDAFFFDPEARKLPFITEIRDMFRMQEKNVWRKVSDHDFSFDKFVIAYDEQTDLQRFRAGIAQDFTFIDRGWGFAEMVPLRYSKETGIEYVLRHYGLQKQDAYAIGDSLNDLPMFEGCGTSIAMGNGEKLIPYADYVTADLRHDGVYQAMEHFLFF
ncbi:MAG: HAD hydrolase family protein [Oscillospiraceae bacterium]|nr:HAD hydrolase family protein [Oscillospiraceae bacterium]